MKEPSIDFYRESVLLLTGGEVTWKETIAVPESWWQGKQIISKDQGEKLQKNVVHVFDIKRSQEEITGNTTVIRWMGKIGTAYVWAYQRQNRWYYTRVFHNPSKGIRSPEDAVKLNSHSRGRPLS
jgi:hypothetical protein